MSELVKIFKFYDETYNYTEIKKQSYYELTIKVSEKYSMENKIVYNITFENNFIKSSTLSNHFNNLIASRANPFALEGNHYECVFIVKNSLTEKIVEYLLMDHEELEKVSGETTAQQYKILIIEALSQFFDEMNSNISNIDPQSALTITATEEGSYYDITYMSIDSSKTPLAHLEEHQEGVYVIKNSLTEIMVEYLLMDYEELEKVCGKPSQIYKISIIEMLAKLWD